MSETPHSWILGVEMSLLDQIRKQSNNPGAVYVHEDQTESVDRESELKDMSRGELNDLASELGVDNPASFANKSGVINAILDAESGNDSGVEDTELDESEVEDILNDTEDDNDTSE